MAYVMALIAGFCAGMVAAALAYDTPLKEMQTLRAEAVSRGVAHYNSTTGIWEWKP